MANSHTLKQREFIVRKLAAFEPPRLIATDFAAVFPDTKCDENDIKRNDPENGAALPPELYHLFIETRERVLLDPKSAPFAEQQARLIMLSNHAKFYNGNNQLSEARAVLRQIAEETGAVGTKGATKAAPAATGDDVVAITRTVVDPKPAEATP